MKKKEENNLRVERHIIKEKHPLYKGLIETSFLSKNLYNYANYYIRQTFIVCSKLAKGKEITKENQEYLNYINGKVDAFNIKRKENYEKSKLKAKKEKKEFKRELKLQEYFTAENKYMKYEFVEYVIKEGVDYRSLLSQVSQQILMILDSNWGGFFESIKKWKQMKDGYTGKPNLPNYLPKKGRNIVVFTNQLCKQKEGYIKFPRYLKGYKLKTKIKEGSLQQVRCLPRSNYFIIEVVYKVETPKEKEDNNKYLSIDIGVDNLATVTNSCNIPPIIINGRGIKAVNKYYNKQTSHYKEVTKRMNNKDTSKRIERITLKRNNKVNDLMHKGSRKIIEYAISCGVNTLVIGNNKDWKRESKLGKKVNQNFVGIPHQKLIKQIKYKAEDVGIKVIITEESYTSGTSYLDKEMPIKENYNKARRIKRGLFKTEKGLLINSDVNGSYQILKKVYPQAYEGKETVNYNPVKINI